MVRAVLIGACLLLLGASGVAVGALAGEPTVATETFTNVVTYTIPTVTETVATTVTETVVSTTTVTETVTTTAPPPPPPPLVVIQPGQSWNAAYQAASCGQVLTLAPGNHGTQRILENQALSNCAANVVFQGGALVTMEEVQFGDCGGCFATNAPDHVTVKGPLVLRGGVSCVGDCHYITIDGVDGGAVALDWGGNPDGPSNWTVQNSDWGPCKADGSIGCNTFYGGGARQIEIEGPLDSIRFINNTIHDFDLVAPYHYECVRGMGGPNGVWRNNKFWGCEIYSLNPGIWLGPNVVIENNWFGGADLGGLNPGDVGPRCTDIGIHTTMKGPIYIRNNSFQDCGGIYSDTGLPPAGTVIATGNLFGTRQCLTGVVFRQNVWDDGQAPCSGTGNRNIPGDFPYVDGRRGAVMNYHIAGAGWVGDGLVPSGCAADDIDGQARPVPCDAGSDER